MCYELCVKMISFLRGKIINKSLNYVIMDVHDIGYKVFVNSSLISQLAEDELTELYVYQHVKEDILALYGFKNLEELELFELLLSISGIGPKSAIGVLAIASAAEIKNSISTGDPSLLEKVSGIGKKTAERVVLELRDKVGKLRIGEKITGETAGMTANSDEIDALMALGYSLQQAREALRKVDPSIKESGARIKEALKGL